MEQQKSSTVTFKQKKGLFLNFWVVVVLLAAAACCLLVVGFVVWHLAPCRPSCEAQHLANWDNGEETAPKAHPYVLLPRSIVPEHYDVELRPYLVPDNFTFKGKVRILVKVLERTDNLTVHINDIVVDTNSVSLTSPSTATVPKVTRTSEDKVREFFILHLDGMLQKGKTYQVEMDYTGNLNDQLVGFYRSNYKDDKGEKRWLATTQFQPTDARRAFPCFDEPALKATFNITITRWSNMSSMSNMPIYDTRPSDDGWEIDYFEKTVRMSTYLLAFVVSDFKSVGTSTFSVWSRAEVINTTAYALEIGPKILRFYEDFFGVKYPLPKTDMIAVPDFNAGAMENWGLITYRETSLLYDPRYASVGNKLRVATVIAHELAHQWFGNLVTPKWWDDLWLNEGFASYVEYLGVNAVHPDWMMDQLFVVDDLQNVLDLDALRTSHPISVPVGHPDEINEIFDKISYGKGASIIRMMSFFLGETTFQKGLTNYLNAKKFDSAVQDDLWAFLTEAHDDKAINVKTVMDSWTLQTGYPVITVTRDYADGTATVNQSRFLLEHDKEAESVNWEVPITYTDGQNSDWTPTTKLWLHRNNGSLAALPRNAWVIVNVQQVGYYRVNYDQQNWKLLLKQLSDDHTRIHIINRAQILDDTMELARAGLLSYDLALNATLYLQRESEYLPWKSSLDTLSYLNSMLSRTAVYGTWKKYISRQLQPLYDRLGWKEDQDEDILKQSLRIVTLSWLCGFGHNDCVEEAQRMFQRWQADTSNLEIISPNLRNVVYCTAVRFGDEKIWDFLWRRYLTATVASEKDKFMFALACAKEPWLLTRYLDWSIGKDTGIRRQDGSTVIRTVGGKLYGRDLTFSYIRDKWDKLFNLYGKSFFAMSGIMKSVTSSLNTQFELNQLRQFYKKNAQKVGSAKRVFDQSIERAEANVRWMEANYANITRWLEAQEGA